MALAAFVALGGLISDDSWIELYALSEMAIYAVSDGWIVLSVRRSERARRSAASCKCQPLAVVSVDSPSCN
jgi:hypothetical protein